MNNTESKNLTQLVIDTRDGIDGAFEKLYEETIKFSYGIACVLLKNEEDIEDVLQNSYMYVAKSIGDLKNPESFESWIGTIVRHECQKYITKRKKIRDIFANAVSSKEIEFISPENIPYDLMEKKEVNEAVRKIVEKLPDDKRACVVLYYFEQKSLSEVAEILGIPEGTVKSRLYSARKTLEKEFKKLQKKDETFYGISIIPLVAAFFAYSVKSISVPASIAGGAAVCAEAVSASAIMTSSASVATGSAAATSAAGAAGGTASAGVTAATSTAVAAKVTAVAVAATVAVGGGAVTVNHIMNNNEAQTASTSITEEYTNYAEVIFQETEISLTETAALITDVITTVSHSAVKENNSSTLTARTQKQTEKATTTSVKSTVSDTTSQKVTTIQELSTTTTIAQTSSVTQAATTTQAVTTTQAATTTQATTIKETTVVPTTNADDIYDVSGGVLGEYTGEGGEVSIPSSVGGDTVTAIGTGAFAGNSNITSVSLPSTITRIGQEAFTDCTELESVYLPSSLQSVGIGAFYGCTNLTDVSIPSGVTNIGDDAFADCSSLMSITVPESVTSIGDNAFGGCDNLIIKCSEGSAAHNYAVENSINYDLI